MYQFSRGQQLLELCEKYALDIPELTIRSELEESGKNRRRVWGKLVASLKVMRESVQAGLAGNLRSAGGLAAGNAARLQQWGDQALSGPVINRASAYALAVSETNAAMGRIVAAPTAGSSGIVPGVILALQEELGLAEEMAVNGLLVAGALGKIIAANATLSGAEGGCQAEVGSAAAMAAGAAVYLSQGTPQQTLDAAAFALKGLLGLVCDPVAGLVEVPCSRRNAIGAAHALICADLALAGIRSFIPFDEMVEAMQRVGRQMPHELRETALGGCAITPSALAFARQMQEENKTQA